MLLIGRKENGFTIFDLNKKTKIDVCMSNDSDIIIDFDVTDYLNSWESLNNIDKIETRKGIYSININKDKVPDTYYSVEWLFNLYYETMKEDSTKHITNNIKYESGDNTTYIEFARSSSTDYKLKLHHFGYCPTTHFVIKKEDIKNNVNARFFSRLFTRLSETLMSYEECEKIYNKIVRPNTKQYTK